MFEFFHNKHLYRGVGILVIKNNSVLLGRRIGIRGYGTYGLPGGFKKWSESFLHCAKRELFEETGLQSIKLFLNFTIQGKTDNYFFYDQIYLIYCGDKEIPQVMEPDKVESWNWYELNNLPIPIYLPTQLAITNYKLKLEDNKNL